MTSFDRQYVDSIRWLNLNRVGATTSYHKWLGGGLVMLFIVFPLSLLGGL